MRIYLTVLMIAWFGMEARTQTGSPSFAEAAAGLMDTLESARQNADRKLTGITLWKLGKLAGKHQHYKEAQEFFVEAVVAAREAGDQYTLVEANIGKASYMRIWGNNKDALTTMRECIEILETGFDHPEADIVWAIQGGNYLAVGKLDSALQFYQESLKVAKEKNRYSGEIQARRGLGNTFFELGAYEQALAEYRIALKYYEQKHAEVGIMMVTKRLTHVYQQLEQWDLARDYALRSLKIAEEKKFVRSRGESLRDLGVIHDRRGELDRALSYYEEARSFFEQSENANLTSNILLRIGQIHLHKQAIEKAKGLFDTAFTLAVSQNSTRDIYDARLARAKAFIAERKFDHAKKELALCRDYFSGEGNPTVLPDVYLLFSKMYGEMGDYRTALDYHQSYAQAKDSTFQASTAQAVQVQHIIDQTVERKNEIRQLTTEKALKEATLQKQYFLIIALVVGLLAVVALAVFYYQNWRKDQLITHQNETLNQQKIKELEQRQQLLSLNAMLVGQEQERQRIAQDLHDGLGGLLSSVRSYFGSLENKIEHHRDRELFGKTHQLLDNAASEVRRIAHNMMPGALTKIGLLGAIQDITHAIEASEEMKISLQAINMEERLPNDKEISLYRIVQEILNNIVKYAQADKVIVQLSRHENLVTLIVEDNGIGFDVNAAKAKGGLGLKGIESRVQFLKGELDLYSKPGEGTSYTIHFPVQEEAVQAS